VFTVSYWSTVLAFGVIGSLTAASIVVLTGWTGQIGLAPLTFVGVGAFATAVMTDAWSWLPAPLVIPLAGLVTIPFAVLVGLPALRLRGFFFALATLTFAFAGQGWLFVQPSLAEKQVDRGVFGERYTQPIFYTALGIAVLVFLALRNLQRTRVARTFFAIRDSETTAQVMGIDPVRYKLLAFGVSGFVAGVAGALNGFLNPDVQAVAFGLQFSLAAVLSAVVSGVGLLFGAVLSGFLFSVLPQLAATPTEGVNQAPVIVGGLLAISTIRDYPNGLASFLARLVRPFHPGERAAWQGEVEADEMLETEPELFEHAGGLEVAAGD
jgi:branched-chain amino acid transport system permease protein